MLCFVFAGAFSERGELCEASESSANVKIGQAQSTGA
jgi:hypothetical protein